MTFYSQRVHAFCLTKMNCNKNETEPKMEHPTHVFREMSLMFQLIQKLGIKSKNMMS